MPLYDYQCPACGERAEYLVPDAEHKVHCFSPDCRGKDILMVRLIAAPSFKIKGSRASNGYGLKFEDTYGKSPVTGKETGCSFTSNRGGTIDHRFEP